MISRTDLHAGTCPVLWQAREASLVLLLHIAPEESEPRKDMATAAGRRPRTGLGVWALARQQALPGQRSRAQQGVTAASPTPFGGKPGSRTGATIDQAMVRASS